MKKSILLFIMLGIFQFQAAQAQEKYIYQPSHEVFEAAYELLNNKDTSACIDYLNKIAPEDTSYVRAQADRAYLLNSTKKYQEALDICNEILARKEDSYTRFCLIKSTSLENLERYDEAINFLKEQLKTYPYYFNFYIKLASAYKKNGNMQEAIDQYRQAIFYNYYDKSAHLQLGLLYAENGYLTKAALCLTMAQIMGNTQSTSLTLISYLEKVLVNEHPLSDNQVKLEDDENFDEIDLLLRNKIALSKQYKIKTKLSKYNFAKSLHLIFEKLEDKNGDDNFWQKNYIQFYKYNWKQGHFDGMLLYSLKGVANQNDEIAKLIKKNAKSIDAFVGKGAEDLRKNATDKQLVVNGVSKELNFHYQSGELVAIGLYKDKPVGDWIYLYPRGQISAVGSYNSDGKREGRWVWFYESGDTSSIGNFNKSGELQGTRRLFHSNGTLKSVANFDKDEFSGTLLEYNRNGILEVKTNYKEGKRHGLQTYLNLVGNVTTEAQWDEGEVNGVVKRYYDNGVLKSEEIYKNTKNDGSYIAYHVDGKTILAKGNYKEDERDGEWIWYHANGKVDEKGAYLKGTPIGHWEVLDEKGELIEAYDYDENGKKNGTYKQYKNGVLVREDYYTKGAYNGYKCFDINGKLISEATKKKNELPLNLYYPNGNIRAKGLYKNDLKEGVWEYYFRNGQLQSKESYEKGLITGKDYGYYATDDLYSFDEYTEGKANGQSARYYIFGGLSQEWFEIDDNKAGYELDYRIDGSLDNSVYFLDNDETGCKVYYDFEKRPIYQFCYDAGLVTSYSSFDTLGKQVYNQKLGSGKASVVEKYTNNQIRFKFEYLNGTRHGESIWYYPNGKIEAKGNYFNGNRHGEWIYYNENGTLESKGNYILNNRTGNFIQYDDFGNKESEGQYNLEGDRIGLWVYYHENGKRAVERTYTNGNLNGKSSFFDTDGNLHYVLFYDDDYLLGYSYNDKNKTLKPMIPFENESGRVEAFFYNGKKSAERTYLFGYSNGAYIKYNMNGSTNFSSTMNKSQYEDYFINYYSNGKIYEKVKYLHDELNGSFLINHPNGKTYIKGNYKAGERHGKFSYYDSNGKLTATWIYNCGVIVKIE